MYYFEPIRIALKARKLINKTGHIRYRAMAESLQVQYTSFKESTCRCRDPDCPQLARYSILCDFYRNSKLKCPWDLQLSTIDPEVNIINQTSQIDRVTCRYCLEFIAKFH